MDGDAGLGVSGIDGGLDAGGAAILAEEARRAG